MAQVPPLPLPSDPRETARALPIALLRAREKVMGPFRNMLSDVGVTEQQWRVLRVLDEQGTQDATEIAHAACLLMPSLTRILHVLEDKGLCTRSPHPTDRRRALIDITESGRALLMAHMPQSNAIYAEIETKLGRRDLDKLLSLLAVLAEER